jgi:N-methylhydantoinase B
MDASDPIVTDPVLLAIVQKQLDHISKQMGWVMTRTARSPIFSQSHDFSCFLGSATGEVLAQADGIPIHTGGGGFALRAVLRDFGTDMAEDDVFILSDPYVAGGNHLPDWTLVQPVFLQGKHVAFVCNRAHQSDIGGGAAGTYNAAATEIFHEGIRLPVLKLVERGTLRRDLWRLLLLNTRCPELMEGDLSAMLGSTRIGAERLAALLQDLGADRSDAYLAALLDHADRRLRSAIAALPDGEWVGIDGSDTDCFQDVDVPIKVTMTKRGETLRFDFTGSSAQIKGFKNSGIANTHSAVYMALSSFFDHDIPRNEGTYRAIEVVAPLGSVVNPRPPAPMTLNTVHPATDITYACWKALAQAMPERACAGWGKVCYGLSSGPGERGVFVMYHWHGSPGTGAVKGRDGFHSMGQFTTLGGLSLPNAEVYETLYPVRVTRQEFRCDSAGPGQFRGGAGVEYDCELLVATEHSTRAEGLGRPSGFGVNGGGHGAGGEFEIALQDGPWHTAPRYGVERCPPMRIRVKAAGGGGFGDPRQRSRAAVRRDLEDGIISPSTASEVYGYWAEGDAAP